MLSSPEDLGSRIGRPHRETLPQHKQNNHHHHKRCLFSTVIYTDHCIKIPWKYRKVSSDWYIIHQACIPLSIILTQSRTKSEFYEIPEASAWVSSPSSALPELTTFSADIRSIALAQKGSDSRRERTLVSHLCYSLLLPQK